MKLLFGYKVLRFSRLFKPVYTPHIWKKKKKRKDDEDKPEIKKEVQDKPGSSGEPGKEMTEEEKAVASIPSVSSAQKSDKVKKVVIHKML